MLLGLFAFSEQYTPPIGSTYTQALLDMCTMPSFAPSAHWGERVTIMRPDPYRDNPNFLTTEAVADTLQVDKKSVYALIHSGQLKSSRRGRHFCIHRIDLQNYRESISNKDAVDKFDVDLSQSVIDSIARHLIAEIRKYYDSEEGQAAFTEWLKQQEEGN